MELVFATGNRGKFNSAKQILGRHGVEIVQKDLGLREIRSNTVEEIALNKAEQAFETLKRPLFVDDSGFIVESLNNFPGPYVNFVLRNIGLQGLLKLVGDNRRCLFRSILVYADSKVGFKIFRAESPGTLAKSPSENSHHEEWSELWSVFIPQGHTKTLNDMTPDEYEERKRAWQQNSAFAKLGRWIAASTA